MGEAYADLKDQIDRAIERGEHFINTCLCDFDLMNEKYTYKSSLQSKWTYERLIDENFALVICIEGEFFKKKKNEIFTDTFLHIRWGDRFPFAYNVKTLVNNVFPNWKLTETWQKDISREFYASKDEIVVNKAERAEQENNNVDVAKNINKEEPNELDSSKINLIEKDFTFRKQSRDSLSIRSNPRLIEKDFTCKKSLRSELVLKNKLEEIITLTISEKEKEEIAEDDKQEKITVTNANDINQFFN